MTSKSSGVADYLASPERAVALLNRVIAGGGSQKEIRQAVAIVAGALERAGYRQAQSG
jgi:hypothetical protein